MKFRFLNVTSDLLAAVMNYLVVVSVWATLNALAGEPDRPLLMLALGLIPLFFYFLRVRVGGFFLFTVIHLAIPVIGYKLYFGPIGGKIVLTIVLSALSLISYIVSMKCEEMGEPVLNPLFAGLIMLGSTVFIGMIDDGRIIFAPKLALLFATLYIPYFYIEKFTWFDYINSKTITNIPTMESLKIGAPIVLGLSLFYGLATFIGLNDTLMGKMSFGIRQFLMKIFSVFTQSAQPESGGVDFGGMYAEQPSGQMPLQDPDYTPSPIAEFLEKAVIFLVIVCITAFLIVQLILLVIRIVKRIKGRDRTRRVKVLDDAVETREKIEKKEKKKPLQALFSEGSYANRVRKLYRRIVIKHPDFTEVPERYTARAFSNLFPTESEQDNAVRFAAIYEKARYSEAEVTKEDYLAAKTYAARLT